MFLVDLLSGREMTARRLTEAAKFEIHFSIKGGIDNCITRLFRISPYDEN